MNTLRLALAVQEFDCRLVGHFYRFQGKASDPQRGWPDDRKKDGEYGFVAGLDLHHFDHIVDGTGSRDCRRTRFGHQPIIGIHWSLLIDLICE